MAAWWLISHNFAHRGFEKCLKISPESQPRSARRNVTAWLGLSDAGTASRDAGMCRRKLSEWPLALEELNNSWRKLQGKNGFVSGSEFLHSSDLDGNEKFAGVNALRGRPWDWHISGASFRKWPLRERKGYQSAAHEPRLWNLWKSARAQLSF